MTRDEAEELLERRLRRVAAWNPVVARDIYFAVATLVASFNKHGRDA
jgi:hypothetical protein